MKIIIKKENFKWHLEAFASELFIYLFFIGVTKLSSLCWIVLFLFTKTNYSIICLDLSSLSRSPLTNSLNIITIHFLRIMIIFFFKEIKQKY